LLILSPFLLFLQRRISHHLSLIVIVTTFLFTLVSSFFFLFWCISTRTLPATVSFLANLVTLGKTLSLFSLVYIHTSKLVLYYEHTLGCFLFISEQMTSYDISEEAKQAADSPDMGLGTVPEENEHNHYHDSHSLKDRDPTDKRNPRNWSLAKKRLLFTALISSSLLADGLGTFPDYACFNADKNIRAMTWGATLVVTQAMDWNISVAHSATSLNYGILLQGFGGIFAVPLIEAYGR
jgi:hypothetical protein